MTREEPVDPYDELEVGSLYGRHNSYGNFMVLSKDQQGTADAGYCEYLILWENGQTSTWRTSLGARRRVPLWKVSSV